MCASDPRRITDLEAYLCRTLGITLLTLAVTSVVLTGVIPLPAKISSSLTQESDSDGNSKNPYAYPTLIYHALSAFYLYTQLAYSFNFAFACGITGSTVLFCLGLWVILFGSDKGRISKKTGADKRTSNFPFENKESAREIKKEKKDREREREGKESKRRSILKSR